MSRIIVEKNLNEAQSVLQQFIADSKNIDAIEKAGELLSKAFKNGNKVISCGNGGSMCDAMHFAEELSGRFREDRKALPAISISDPSHISCVGNDNGAIFPPSFPVKPMMIIPFCLAAFIPFITLTEFPLVLIANSISPFVPTASMKRENILSNP